MVSPKPIDDIPQDGANRRKSNRYRNVHMDEIKTMETPRCIATTDNAPSITIPDSGGEPSHESSNFFKGAEWSADGTTILTNSEDNNLRSYILPPDLLEVPSPHDLDPYCRIQSPEPVYATALYPYFNLQDPRTTLHLSSVRDHPIALHSTIQLPSSDDEEAPLATNPIRATYPLVHETTETFTTPHSLLFTSGGTHFLAGSDSLISLFDISRPGEGPVTQYPTIPSKRKKIVGGGVGMKGLVSGMASCSATGVLAAGTFTRQLGLYDAEGSGNCIAVFSLAEAKRKRSGAGVTQVLWSPSGRYLFVAERKSDVVLVYDIRMGKKLGVLKERNALTNQRLGIILVPREAEGDGVDVWAGGVDGKVRVWKDVTGINEEKGPDQMWDAHGDPISSILIHSSKTVAASCSGQRRQPSNISDSDTDSESDLDSSDSSDSSSSSSDTYSDRGDSTLKIWHL